LQANELEQRILLHKCDADRIGLTEKVDFVSLFYMIHEVPDQVKLFVELKSILNPNAKIYIIEPKFHVSKRAFELITDKIKSLGFEIIVSPKVLFSRTVLLTIKKKIFISAPLLCHHLIHEKTLPLIVPFLKPLYFTKPSADKGKNRKVN